MPIPVVVTGNADHIHRDTKAGQRLNDELEDGDSSVIHLLCRAGIRSTGGVVVLLVALNDIPVEAQNDALNLVAKHSLLLDANASSAAHFVQALTSNGSIISRLELTDLQIGQQDFHRHGLAVVIPKVIAGLDRVAQGQVLDDLLDSIEEVLLGAQRLGQHLVVPAQIEVARLSIALLKQELSAGYLNCNVAVIQAGDQQPE